MMLRDHLDLLIRSPTIEELWDAHVQKMAEYGFDRLLYGFTRYRTSTSLGDPEDFVILTNHCREYTDGFLKHGLYRKAPMVRWALENDGACSWTVLNQRQRNDQITAEEKEVIGFNRSLGIEAGYTISFRSISARSKGAIALTARPGLSQSEVDSMWEEHGPDIKLMNDLVHLKILSLPHRLSKRGLTKRQREALEWVGDGKTTQDIALLMGLTPATVEKHLRLARETLSVETTAQAVLKAAFANQIFILEA
jgi:LuxR family transcriptional regulator